MQKNQQVETGHALRVRPLPRFVASAGAICRMHKQAVNGDRHSITESRGLIQTSIDIAIYIDYI
jgi:hypothetical protein